MTGIPVFDVITGHVLSMADSGRLTKRTHPDGTWTVHIDDADQPAPEGSYVQWALTILRNNPLHSLGTMPQRNHRRATHHQRDRRPSKSGKPNSSHSPPLSATRRR